MPNMDPLVRQQGLVFQQSELLGAQEWLSSLKGRRWYVQTPFTLCLVPNENQRNVL